MSNAVEHEQATIGPPDDHEHPDDSLYLKVAAILGAITAAEVATFYVDVGKAGVPMLITMMIAKFAIVAAYFMHLRFDRVLFTRVFVSGILLASGVYMIALTTFHIWIQD